MSRVDVPKPPKKRYMDALVSFVILCSFLFIVGAVVLASLNDARKPAIYLYPLRTQWCKCR
jgi:lipopolysaccharide/colanic/teichoic acid biosynthesis glycosyltransferase